MGTIWQKEFVGGLDTRRLPETTPGGVLLRLQNGHINRGGEVEQRAAFVPEFELPAGTVGLAKLATSLVVFGSGPTPTGMPVGVTYQRLQHPDGVQALVSVPSVDRYDGKIYAVGEFADGSRYHYFDGARVTAWYDGRARTAFSINGGATAAVRAQGLFEISGGTAGGGNDIADVQIDGVSIISGSVAHTGNNATTATAVAAAINGHTSTPDYTATTSGQLVIITAVTAGAAPNGKAVQVTTAGDVVVIGATVMGGGANAAAGAIAAITVNGVAVTNGTPVSWSSSNTATASAVAAAINSYASTPDYTATAVGDTINVVAAAAGATPNGYVVQITATGQMTVSPGNVVAMAGGSDLTASYTPGAAVSTVGKKVYSVSGPTLHFSGIGAPTKWTTDTTGAGFVQLSSEASDADDLKAVAPYQGLLAVFAENTTLIWYIDPDPALNKKSQILNNTGTAHPRSVTQFGDSDLFYAHQSGLRSLRARDASNAAATTDIGVPVDTLITAKLEALVAEGSDQVIGLINPADGRFWLICKDEVFVFSFYPQARVSAWSTYNLSTMVDGEETPFSADYALVYRRRVYVRSGDTIYAYGGTETTIAYDDVPVVAWMPYLDANDPAAPKQWTGFDVAARGEWQVAAAMNPTNLDAADDIATINMTSYSLYRMPFAHMSTHISMRFTSTGKGAKPARLSSVAIHFSGDAGAS